VAAALLVVGVCLGLQSRPHVESPAHLTFRFAATALAVVLFFMYVAESMGFGPPVATVLEWIGLRAQRLWESGDSLLRSAL
jgi:hypothetical protein